MLSPITPIECLATLAPFTAVLPIFNILYQFLLPKPIPGIPYNNHVTKTQSRRYSSPIFQVWLGPFTKPALVVADFQEGQDILLRRKELNRSSFMSNVLSGEAKSFHITLKTGPQWKAQRRLLQDLMTLAFLHRVAAPNIYKSALRLLDLWKRKAQLADGSAFSAEHDVFYAALDAVLDFGFGDAAPMRTLVPQAELLASMSAADVWVK
ncbi:cytochrome P450 [Colletotrichum salicis]|uniref:Cytochrome P450 n=1 Tax=Colletotrichum salicis TaxID=1209931 RepID=A0A135V2T6_9PEZI|nr:cytochrome P450 [Colletotrichum salicis]